MARIPLIEEQARPELAGLIGRIRGARGGRLINLYRMLLLSPPLASAWLDFNNAVRYETELDDRTRELVIMRVAALTGCGYVLRIHAERYAEPAGVTPKQVEALSARGDPALFGPRERALLAYVDAMTRDVEVPDATFDALRDHYAGRQLVELTVLIGAYNMQTRLLKALDIDPEKA